MVDGRQVLGLSLSLKLKRISKEQKLEDRVSFFEERGRNGCLKNQKGMRQERMPLESEERKKERLVPFPFLLHRNLVKCFQNFL